MALVAGLIATGLLSPLGGRVHAQGGLAIERLDVTPILVLSGGTVDLIAVVRNISTQEVTGLNLSVALARESPTARGGRPLASDPSGPLSLAPGATVEFKARVQLVGNNWQNVGIMGFGDGGTYLAPQGSRVRIVDLAESASETMRRFGLMLPIITVGFAGVTLGRRLLRARSCG